MKLFEQKLKTKTLELKTKKNSENKLDILDQAEHQDAIDILKLIQIELDNPIFKNAIKECIEALNFDIEASNQKYNETTFKRALNASELHITENYINASVVALNKLHGYGFKRCIKYVEEVANQIENNTPEQLAEKKTKLMKELKHDN